MRAQEQRWDSHLPTIEPLAGVSTSDRNRGWCGVRFASEMHLASRLPTAPGEPAPESLDRHAVLSGIEQIRLATRSIKPKIGLHRFTGFRPAKIRREPVRKGNRAGNALIRAIHCGERDIRQPCYAARDRSRILCAGRLHAEAGGEHQDEDCAVHAKMLVSPRRRTMQVYLGRPGTPEDIISEINCLNNGSQGRA